MQDTADSIRSPAVSVLMPCHNAQGSIDGAINSILKQTLRDLELVIVDDGSTDASLKLMKRRQKQDQRVRVISIEHAGIVEALNIGLETCRAKFIARMDADDWSYPTRLERQLELLNQAPELAVAGCLVKGFPDQEGSLGISRYLDWLNGLVEAEDIAKEIFIESPLPHPSTLIRRTWLDRVGGYHDCGWAEDYDLWLRMDHHGARFAKVPEVLFSWCDHPGRLTRIDSRYSVENFLRAKAHYLCTGPLIQRDALLLWGAGQMGRRVSKHLLRGGAPLEAFVDIDPKKIGRTMKERPIVSVEELPRWWEKFNHPALLAAVGSHGARGLIREHLTALGLREGVDWWAVA